MHHYLLFDNIFYSYPNGFEALRGITLRITHGERVALAGENGSGKSTLLLHANALLQPSSGRVVVGGIEARGKGVRLVRERVGLLFQDADNQLFMPTVEEDIAFGLENISLPQEQFEGRIVEALRAVGAEALRHREPHLLSGGQKRRVALAGVMAMMPDILIMDEPTSGLDPRSRREVIELLKGFDHTMLIATHDMPLIEELCERVVVMSEGRVVADAPTRSIFSDDELLYRYGLKM